MELRFPLILDGATGTELQKRGYTGDISAEQWTLEHPEAIVDIQKGYVAAGSQVLYTPTFGANRRKLEEHGIFNRTEDYNRRLAALSEQAPKIAPERSNNRNFFIQKHELQFVTSAPGGGISGMYRQRIRYKYSELSPFPNSSVPERLFQRAGTFC